MTPVSNKFLAAVGIVGVVMVGLAIWVTQVAALKPHPLPQGVSSPTIALELIRVPTAAVVNQIVHTPTQRARMVASTKIDDAFIAAYAVFFLLVGAYVARTYSRALGVFVIVAGVTAAACDVAENRAILALLAGGVANPRFWSLPKWALLFSALLAMAPALIDRRALFSRRWTGYAAAAVCVVAGIEGWYGIVVADDKLVEAAAGRLALALLLVLLFVTSCRFLRDGVLTAFDRLAETPWLRSFAEWPEADHDEVVGGAIGE